MAANDDYAKECMRRFGALETSRGIWNQHWEEINDRVLLRPSGFNTEIIPGSKQTHKVFDSTAPKALRRFASAVESVLCARNERWHGLEPIEPGLRDDPEVKLYCEALTDLLFRLRYAAHASFAAEAQECFLELGAFGTHIMMVDDSLNHRGLVPRLTPIVHQCVPLASCFIEENSLGQVDTTWRVIRQDARQAVQMFGDKTPAKIRQAFDKRDPKKWTFVHCCHPTIEYNEASWDYRAMPYTSAYVWRDEPTTIQIAGVGTLPFAVGRNVTNAEEVYGRSPAMDALPDIKNLNEVNKTMIRQAHRSVEPPLLIYDDGMGSSFDVTPNALNYGMVDERGNPRVRPLDVGGKYEIGVDVREDFRKSINESFYITLFQILVENKEMTAYEAALRAQEKAELLGPTFGRQETEFLSRVVDRELEIAWNRGIIIRSIGPMPRQLARAGGKLKVSFTNQLAFMRRAPEAARTLTAMNQLAPIAAIDPSVMDGFDPDGVRKVICDANGVPQRALRTDAAVKAYRDSKAQREEIAGMVEAAPQIGKAAKDLAAASEISDRPIPPLPLAA